MHSVALRHLKSNPFIALREARSNLVVMDCDRSDAVLVGMERLGIADLPHVRTVFSVSLFRSDDISAVTAADVAGKSQTEMIALLSSMNISLYKGSLKGAIDEMAAGKAWLNGAFQLPMQDHCSLFSTSAHCALAEADFRPAMITEAVRREVCTTASFPGQDLIVATLPSGALFSIALDMTHWRLRFADVETGEASAIAFAETAIATEVCSALLIVDDQLGRLEAQSCGLKIIGTAAIVGLAKTRGLIPRADELLRAMQASGYFLGDAVVRAILDRVGE